MFIFLIITMSPRWSNTSIPSQDPYPCLMYSWDTTRVDMMDYMLLSKTSIIITTITWQLSLSLMIQHLKSRYAWIYSMFNLRWRLCQNSLNSKPISQISKPILGMFVLIWMHNLIVNPIYERNLKNNYILWKCCDICNNLSSAVHTPAEW